MKLTTLFVACLLLLSTRVFGEVVDTQAVRAIIGEAARDGYRGMLGVACAIRNRGTLQGVVGLHAPHIDQESDKTWRLAWKAWADSRLKDVTKGATHWDGTQFKRPYWSFGMTETVIIGHNRFYKPPAYGLLRFNPGAVPEVRQII